MSDTARGPIPTLEPVIDHELRHVGLADERYTGFEPGRLELDQPFIGAQSSTLLLGRVLTALPRCLEPAALVEVLSLGGVGACYAVDGLDAGVAMYRTPRDERLSVAAVRDTHSWRIGARHGGRWLRAGPAAERALIW